MNQKIKKIIFTIIIAIGFLSYMYVFIRINEIKNQRQIPLRSYFANYYRKPVLISDIAPWMTFDYINKIFHIPKTFLEQSLKINDKKYPIITIGQYSKKIGTSTSILIKDMQDLIQTYSASSTTK